MDQNTFSSGSPGLRALLTGSESFARALLGLGQALVVADRFGGILLVTPEAERLMGVLSTETAPDGWFQNGWPRASDCYLPDANTPFPAGSLPMARALRGETVTGEVMFLRNGHPGGRWIRVTAHPVLNAGEDVLGGVVLLQDCTDNHRVIEKVSATLAEKGVSRHPVPHGRTSCLPIVKTLLRQYEWIFSAVEQSADGVIITDRMGVIQYVNPGFTQTTGYSAAEAVGQTPSILKSGKHGPEFYREIWAKILSGDPYRGVILNRKKSGESFASQQSISPIHDESGNITHFVSVLKDVSDLLKGKEREFQMQLAREIQERFYGAAIDLPGYDIAGATVQAEEVGGDYFDFIPMEGGGLGIVVADVTGHGVGAALVMAETRAYLRALSSQDRNLGDILTRTNRALFHDLPENRFVTLFMARLNPSERTMIYASAGHVPGILMNRAAEEKARFLSLGPPLGIFKDQEYAPSGTVSLEEGDVLLLMTDGVLEMLDRNGEELGVEGAVRYLRAHSGQPAREILKGLQSFIRAFNPDEAVPDDVTGVVVKVGS